MNRPKARLRSRRPFHPLYNRARIVIRAKGHDLPVHHVKAVDERDGAERGIEIKHRGAPLAVYDVPDDVDAFYRRKQSSDRLSQSGGPFDWGRAVPRTLYRGGTARH